MEQKIVETLGKMSTILSNYYPPSSSKLYSLRRLGIVVPRVNYKDRTDNVTDDDKNKLAMLLRDLTRFVDQYGVPPKQKYYISLWLQHLTDILNSV